jgi:hypothetical protein
MGYKDPLGAMALEKMRHDRAVLELVLAFHPEHLTVSELVLKMASGREEEEEIANAIRDLKGSGLVRCVDNLVVPTHSALQAAELLLLP